MKMCKLAQGFPRGLTKIEFQASMMEKLGGNKDLAYLETEFLYTEELDALWHVFRRHPNPNPNPKPNPNPYPNPTCRPPNQVSIDSPCRSWKHTHRGPLNRKPKRVSLVKAQEALGRSRSAISGLPERRLAGYRSFPIGGQRAFGEMHGGMHSGMRHGGAPLLTPANQGGLFWLGSRSSPSAQADRHVSKSIASRQRLGRREETPLMMTAARMGSETPLTGSHPSTPFIRKLGDTRTSLVMTPIMRDRIVEGRGGLGSEHRSLHWSGELELEAEEVEDEFEDDHESEFQTTAPISKSNYSHLSTLSTHVDIPKHILDYIDGTEEIPLQKEQIPLQKEEIPLQKAPPPRPLSGLQTEEAEVWRLMVDGAHKSQLTGTPKP